MSKLMDLYSYGSMPMDILSKKIKDLNDQKEALSFELDQLDDEKEVDVEDLIDQILSAKEIKEKGTLQEQRSLIVYLIDKIVLYDNDQIEIHWSFT